MTTILADARLGLMVCDSCITDGDRLWSGQKIFRVRDHLLGFAGETHIRGPFMEWWKTGGQGMGPSFKGGVALVMTPDRKLLYFDGDRSMEVVRGGRDAIGTGAKAAIAAYDALGWKDPQKAVRIACRHDSMSRTPVRTHHMKETG